MNNHWLLLHHLKNYEEDIMNYFRGRKHESIASIEQDYFQQSKILLDELCKKLKTTSTRIHVQFHVIHETDGFYYVQSLKAIYTS